MVSSRDASEHAFQKKCKKRGLPYYFSATAPFYFGERKKPPMGARRLFTTTKLLIKKEQLKKMHYGFSLPVLCIISLPHHYSTIRLCSFC